MTTPLHRQCSRCLRPVLTDDRGRLLPHLGNEGSPCDERRPRPVEAREDEQLGMWGRR